MTDVQEMKDFISKNPQDYEARWRLVKCLYAGLEYRQAMEHLVLLKNEWDLRINVRRYLAACYYRLGRYDEAIAELRDAIRLWPEETPLQEQLARALEVSGRRIEAMQVWEGILDVDQEHPTATRSVTRLKGETPVPIKANIKELLASDDKELFNSDTVLMGVSVVCPVCGAQNNDEFERCWQCHASLKSPKTTPPVSTVNPPSKPEEEKKPDPTKWYVLGWFGTSLLLLAGGYATLQNTPFLPDITRTTGDTLNQFLRYELFFTRLVAAAALLFVWPLAWWITLGKIRPLARSIWLALIFGLALTGVTYLASFLPPQFFIVSLILPAILNLCLLIYYAVPRVQIGILVWIIQQGVVMLTILSASAGFQGYRFVMEIPAIIDYQLNYSSSNSPGQTIIPGIKVPSKVRLEFQSSGSSWLDERCGTLYIDSRTEDDSLVLLELKDTVTNETHVFERMKANPHRIKSTITAGRQYVLMLRDPKDVSITLTFHCLLEPTRQVDSL